METMERMDENEVDLVLTDPPYGQGREKGTGKWGRLNNNVDKNWDVRPSQKIFNLLFDISQNQIFFGGNYFDLPPTRGFLVWDKGEGFYGRDFAEAELVWTSFDDNAKIYKHDPLANGDYKDKLHPTQKPLAVVKFILQDWAKSDWTIYDPFTGSGSIPLACEQLDYEWIASEKDDDYVEKARERIKRERDQLKAF